MKNVLLSQKIHEKAYAMLEGRVNILVPEKLGQEAFEELLPQADAVILRTNVKMTAEAIAKAVQLKIICRTGAGTDNVDKDACRERGIILTNTPTANSISVAEHAVALALTLSKRVAEYDAAVRNGGWQIRTTNASSELFGKTAGVMGLGNIGRRAAKMLHNGFDMDIIAFDPFAKAEDFPEYKLTDDPVELFSVSDIITMHCPSIPETRGMVNDALLARVKPGAIFINCARGDLVDEEALARALTDGRLAAAGLDVFSAEPPAADNPLLGLKNVTVTPHSAALTKEASVRMATQAVSQVLMYFDGRTPEFTVKL